MKVAVFGSTGFVGRHVIEELDACGIECVGVSRSVVNERTVQIDFDKISSFDVIPSDVDAAIICSAKLPQRSYSLEDTRAFMHDNVNGVLSILDWASRTHVRKIVYCSTLSMIPPARTAGPLIDIRSHAVYKVSKAAAEHLVSEFCVKQSIDYTILRIASVYGPGMKPDVLKTVVDAAKTGGAFTVSNRQVVVDFVHVSDVAAAAVASLSKPLPSPYVNASSGTPIPLLDVCGLIEKIIGSKLNVEVRGDEPVEVSIHSIDTFRKLLDREPTPIEVGLKELIRLYTA